jgi:hypothetical protein
MIAFAALRDFQICAFYESQLKCPVRLDGVSRRTTYYYTVTSTAAWNPNQILGTSALPV